MAEQWYNKYRPKTMQDYSGDRIKNLIKNRFKYRDNLPHVILLSGERGCGKTTCERILSKYFLCENPTADGEPCECCEACKSINEILIQGELGVECPGIEEYDTSSVNGKSPIESIIEEARIEPMYTKYKIIAFDECHTLTNAAQNALLKTLEDIPDHLVVMLCTTNREKILAPVLSRVQFEIQVTKQSIEEMTKRLMFISQQENLTVSKDALELIAKRKDRVPRECITLLENVALTYDKKVTVENVMDYLDDRSNSDYLDFFRAANDSLEAVVNYANKVNTVMNESAKRNFIDGLVGFVLEALNIKYGIGLDEYTPEYVKEVSDLFKMYNTSDFDALLQVMENAVKMYIPNNDVRNTLTIINTAIRISKIDAIANGLAYEPGREVVENNISMIEHAKQTQRNTEEIAERLYKEIGDNYVEENFSGASTVSGEFDFINKFKSEKDQQESEDVQREGESNSAEQGIVSTGNEVIDSFFNQNN